jgi:hypothetical protein
MACSTGRVGTRQSTEYKVKGKGTYNENFDPMTLKGDDISVPENVTPRDTVQENTTESLLIPTEKEMENREVVRGFRIQLFATKNEEEAREAKQRAIMKFQERVSLDFESPYYKLRIGDCQTRKEAEQLKEKAIRLGFDDPEPWIIQSRVFRKQEAESLF